MLVADDEVFQKDYMRYRYKPGKKPSKVVLIAPHTHEHPAVLPFLRALSSKLMTDGIETEEHKITDTMERALRIRKKLSRAPPEVYLKPFSDEMSADCAVTNMLSLLDCLTRLKLINNKVIQAGQDVLGLELHSSGYLAAPDNLEEYYQDRLLPDTDIVIIGGSFKDLNSNILRWYDRMAEREEGLKPYKMLASYNGLDLDAMLREVKYLSHLSRKAYRRLKLIELPGSSVEVEKGTEMHDYYCKDEYGNHASGYYGSIKISGWESTYCTSYLQSEGFTDLSIERVSACLVL